MQSLYQYFNWCLKLKHSTIRKIHSQMSSYRNAHCLRVYVGDIVVVQAQIHPGAQVVESVRRDVSYLHAV